MNQRLFTSRLESRTPLIIHVLTSLDYGGVERHMEVIANVLDHSKMRHVFVAIGSGGATETKLQALGADVRCLGQKTKIPSIGAIVALLMLFRRERPQVVHAHGAEANFHGLIAAYLARINLRIGEEIGIPSHSNNAKKIFKLIYATAHRVIGVSRVVSEWLVDSGEVPAGKILQIDNPVGLPRLTQSAVEKPEFMQVVYVGRLEHVKNPLGLLIGFSKLLAYGLPAKLWFIGSGSEKSTLERMSIQLGVNDKVQFFGFQKNPEEFIRQAHIFVQPSISEGFSLGLVEAMSCGVPVISTAVGSAPEIVQSKITGWLLNNSDPELLTAALKEAWQLGPHKLNDMGEHAKQSVEGRFEPLHYLARIEAQYENLLATNCANSKS